MPSLCEPEEPMSQPEREHPKINTHAVDCRLQRHNFFSFSLGLLFLHSYPFPRQFAHRRRSSDQSVTTAKQVRLGSINADLFPTRKPFLPAQFADLIISHNTPLLLLMVRIDHSHSGYSEHRANPVQRCCPQRFHQFAHHGSRAGHDVRPHTNVRAKPSSINIAPTSCPRTLRTPHERP